MQTVPFVPFAVDPIFGESDAEELLPEIPVEHIGRGERKTSGEAHSILQTSSGMSTPSSSVLTALKSVLPDSIDEEVLPSSSIVCHDMKVFTSPLQRQILFSVANNFAGVGASDMQSVIRFLRTEMDETLYQLILHSPGYSSRAIAQNIFKGAIEAGDANIVDLLLTDRLAGIDVNRQLCSVAGEPFTPIERASALGHVDVIRSLLRHHADVNQTLRPFQDFGGALDYAIGVPYVRYGKVDPEIFRMLLQAGGDLSENVIKLSERGVFHKAVTNLREQTSIAIIEIMVDVGADLDYSYNSELHDTTPQRVIDVAAQRGSLEMVKVLLNNRASLSGDTLTYAVRSRNEDLIHFLLERGADINSKGSQGMTAFEEALRVRNDRIIILLRARGALVDLKNPVHASAALRAASEVGDVAFIKYLLQLECQISPDDLGSALIQVTKIRGYKEVAMVLRGELINLKDPKYVSAALMVASEVGDVAFIKYLLQLECQISPDDLGSALKRAIFGGFEEVAMVLLDAGAETALSLQSAIQFCSPALVFALLDAGADPKLSLEDATERGDRSVIEALMFAGADVNYVCPGPWVKPVLTLAVAQKDYELVQLLLDSGANINVREIDSHRPTVLQPLLRVGISGWPNSYSIAGQIPMTPRLLEKHDERIGTYSICSSRNTKRGTLWAGKGLDLKRLRRPSKCLRSVTLECCSRLEETATQCSVAIINVINM